MDFDQQPHKLGRVGRLHRAVWPRLGRCGLGVVAFIDKVSCCRYQRKYQCKYTTEKLSFHWQSSCWSDILRSVLYSLGRPSKTIQCIYLSNFQRATAQRRYAMFPIRCSNKESSCSAHVATVVSTSAPTSRRSLPPLRIVQRPRMIVSCHGCAADCWVLDPHRHRRDASHRRCQLQ